MKMFDKYNIITLIFNNIHYYKLNSLTCAIDNKIIFKAILKLTPLEKLLKSLGKQTFKLKSHQDIINCLAISPGGDIISSSFDTQIKIWDIKTFNCIKTLKADEYAITAIILLQTRFLIAGSFDGILKAWDTNDNYNCISTVKAHTSCINSLLNLPNNQFASCSADYFENLDNSIKIWEFVDSKFICINKLTEEIPVACLAYSQKNNYLISGSGKTVKLWDIKGNYTCINTLARQSENVITVLEMSNGLLLTGSYDNTIAVWDGNNGYEYTYTFHGHSKGVRCLTEISKCYFVSGSLDGTIKIWDIQMRKCINTLLGHSLCSSAMLILKDGRIISAGFDCEIIIWEY
jgi:WD40 repeat protein